MSDQLIALVIPPQSEPFAILSTDVGMSTQDGIGRACAHVGCVNRNGLSVEAQRFCEAEHAAMLDDVRMFEAWLKRCDPALVAWLAEGAQSVPADAFSGKFDDVVADSDREDYVGC